ncbi:MAG TPA: hypothetical protein VLA54_14375, partial [Acidimicrobiia bacterium]|nr:hypothetical protein [Acidimicrobiia bacterium]
MSTDTDNAPSAPAPDDPIAETSVSVEPSPEAEAPQDEVAETVNPAAERTVIVPPSVESLPDDFG